MKKVLAVLSIIFSIISIIGAVYVIFTKGKVNVGLAVIPMIFALVLCSIYTAFSRKTN